MVVKNGGYWASGAQSMVTPTIVGGFHNAGIRPKLCESLSKTHSGKCDNKKCDSKCREEKAVRGDCQKREGKYSCFCSFKCSPPPPTPTPTSTPRGQPTATSTTATTSRQPTPTSSTRRHLAAPSTIGPRATPSIGPRATPSTIGPRPAPSALRFPESSCR
ncbi:hypothetical protein L1987_39931 [Smallanthus sonchifolius]|uniref:Uncharacterized protein n=1 Tax=Smallanthus sonchifolius TaxID=185202 RepID=A0ACB9GS70_9ASTR|nr:hypothetical protein L1987_39931 [Smallanthus sonchifolius]